MILQEWSPAVKVPLSEKGSASNTQRSVYEVDWDCNMDLTGTGMRGELALDVAVQDFGCVTIPIMAKVYRSSDNSAAHGEQGWQCWCRRAAVYAFVAVCWCNCLLQHISTV
jgi:hypothetical protein